jgi:hypothetical protein
MSLTFESSHRGQAIVKALQAALYGDVVGVVLLYAKCLLGVVERERRQSDFRTLDFGTVVKFSALEQPYHCLSCRFLYLCNARTYCEVCDSPMRQLPFLENSPYFVACPMLVPAEPLFSLIRNMHSAVRFGRTGSKLLMACGQKLFMVNDSGALSSLGRLQHRLVYLLDVLGEDIMYLSTEYLILWENNQERVLMQYDGNPRVLDLWREVCMFTLIRVATYRNSFAFYQSQFRWIDKLSAQVVRTEMVPGKCTCLCRLPDGRIAFARHKTVYVFEDEGPAVLFAGHAEIIGLFALGNRKLLVQQKHADYTLLV